MHRCIEALTRVGDFDKAALQQSIRMFEVRERADADGGQANIGQDFLQYTNHVGLCTEEISPAGEG
jgi:hypothetical protein